MQETRAELQFILHYKATPCLDEPDDPPPPTQLSLEGVVDVDDGVMGKAAAHCPRLVTLNIARCSKVTDAGVATAASSLAKLESVSVSEIPRLSDKALGALALAPELHTLHARRCHRFSDAAVAAVCSMGRIRHIVSRTEPCGALRRKRSCVQKTGLCWASFPMIFTS